jgi:hypothetical protein
VTAILYLNDVAAACGGATVFPLANAEDDSPALASARRLMGAGLAHTRGARGSSGLVGSNEDDAALLELAMGEIQGVRIQPQIGRLCVFFTRNSKGEIDPRSWHGGERLSGSPDDHESTDKHILTLFKEVHYGQPHPVVFETSLEGYLAPQIAAQRRFLTILASSHAPYFIP